MEADGKVCKQVGGRGYYAVVRVSCQDTGDGSSSVALGPGVNAFWAGQADYLDAALVGAALALKLAGASTSCLITNLRDGHCDTTPTLVAIAAIRAVWAAVRFTPDKTVAMILEACILRGAKLTPADLEKELSR